MGVNDPVTPAVNGPTSRLMGVPDLVTPVANIPTGKVMGVLDPVMPVADSPAIKRSCSPPPQCPPLVRDNLPWVL